MRTAIMGSILGLTLFTGFAYAESDNHFNTLSINITNATSNLCMLSGSYLRYGEFFLTQNIPEYIPAYSSAASIILDSSFSGDLELSYSCGENKRITFDSKVDAGWFVDTVSAGVLSAQHMMAEYKIVQGLSHHTINWRFTELS